MQRRPLVLAVALLLLGACSQITGGGGPPDERVASAFEGLWELEGVTMTMTLESDPESLSALAKAGGDEMEADLAQKILDSRIVVTSKQAENPLDGEAEFVFDIAGVENAFEIKVVDRVFYLRADVRGLVETFGDPSDAGEVDAFVNEAEAQGFDFAAPAVNGEWLSIKGFDQLAKQMGMPSPSDNSAAIRAFGEAIREDATVKHVGEDDAGTHFETTISLRRLYERILPQLQEMLGASGAPMGAFPKPAQVPDENFTLDVWLDGDRLSQIEVDFLKLQGLIDEEIPAGVERLALRLAFEEFTGEVEAPGDAVEIDPQQIMQALFGAMMGSDSATGGTVTETEEFPCEMLESEPEEVQAMYYEQCPQLKN